MKRGNVKSIPIPTQEDGRQHERIRSLTLGQEGVCSVRYGRDAQNLLKHFDIILRHILQP